MSDVLGPTARRLGQLLPADRESIVQVIHAEAQAAGWHHLNTSAKSQFYKRWEELYGLTHAAVKDGIMKGFDVAQGIPASGEAAVHSSLLVALQSSRIPYVRSKVRRAEWRREVDFVLGFSERFLTHIAELEPAPSWPLGLQQCLLYKSLYYQASRVQALPTLILFGDVSAARWEQISTVCVDQRVLLLAYQLRIDGVRLAGDIIELLGGDPARLPFEEGL